MRFRKHGSIHDVSGMSAFTRHKHLILYIIGLMNTKIGDLVLRILNPTLNSQVGDFQNIPVILNNAQQHSILSIVTSSIISAEIDWDTDETSWDFKRHPLV